MTNIYLETPLVYSEKLSEHAPCKVYLKQECNQPSGSFKHRGISNNVKALYEKIKADPSTGDKKVVVVASSGGNAGNAAAHVAASLGLESIIVVPELVTAHMKNMIGKNATKIIVHGKNFAEADEHLCNVVLPSLDDCVPIYCHPYEGLDIWRGHATMIDEIVEDLKAKGQLQRLKAVACSVGGGGLYCGVVEGLNRNGLNELPVLTLECETCPSFQAAIDAGEPVVLSGCKTIATSLGASSVSPKAVECYNAHKTKHVLVKDSQAASSCIKFYQDHNIVVEPACGAALASAYEGLFSKNKEFFGELQEDDIVIVVVCGGVATTLEDLEKYKETYAL